MRTQVAGVLLVAVAIACGGSPPSVAFVDFDREMQASQCVRLTRCALFEDEASCESYFRLSHDVSVAGAIDAGKTRYDGAKASACIQQVGQQSCDLGSVGGRTPPEACSAVFVGSLQGGEPCSIDAECASGTCALPGDCPESGCCVGACRPTQAPAGDGGSCAKDPDCQAGLVCSSKHSCRKPALAGADCDGDGECADGLGCINPLATMPGSCRALPHLGEVCPYHRCAEQNLRCDDATHTCVALGLTGASCSSAQDCSPYKQCNAASHLCEDVPSLGMPCTVTCSGDSYCRIDNTGAGACVAPQANGAACESRSDCASFYCFVGPLFDDCADPPVCI